jgi:hypothetical protein
MSTLERNYAFQPLQRHPRLLNERLELRVGILPQGHEGPVMLDRPRGVPRLLVDLRAV